MPSRLTSPASSPDVSRSSDRPRVRGIVTACAITGLLAGGLLTALNPPVSAAATAGQASAAAALAPMSAAVAPAAAAENPVTPGNITGYGFDQCETQNQKTMNKWMQHSPFLAVGIYISGDSRACRTQSNLDATWVRKQLNQGWSLLPITLGPQASCQPRFPRYDDDFKISANPGSKKNYQQAWNQGVAEARKAVVAARNLGIVPRSTLFYDLEGFDLGNYHCRESALVFLSGWTAAIRSLNYVSGVYSSAGSGMKMLDDARVERPDAFHLPDQIWLARYDNVANTSTEYLRGDGWRPGGRVKQYTGGHDEVWGGVRINIDRNYLDLGTGSTSPSENRCGGVRVGFVKLPFMRPGASGKKVRGLQCLLKEKRLYSGPIDGQFTGDTVSAAKAWQVKKGFRATNGWTKSHWATLYAAGSRPALKVGSHGDDVLRAQRALNAVYPQGRLKSTGVFDDRTVAAVKGYQQALRIKVTGVTNYQTWRKLRNGAR
ncbi:hypothetical protein GCM10027020_13520 [Nocardioides salsibiostraticola]